MQIAILIFIHLILTTNSIVVAVVALFFCDLSQCVT
jgi:hypothetical protein